MKDDKRPRFPLEENKKHGPASEEKAAPEAANPNINLENGQSEADAPSQKKIIKNLSDYNLDEIELIPIKSSFDISNDNIPPTLKIVPPVPKNIPPEDDTYPLVPATDIDDDDFSFLDELYQEETGEVKELPVQPGTPDETALNLQKIGRNLFKLLIPHIEEYNPIVDQEINYKINIIRSIFSLNSIDITNIPIKGVIEDIARNVNFMQYSSYENFLSNIYQFIYLSPLQEPQLDFECDPHTLQGQTTEKVKPDTHGSLVTSLDDTIKIIKALPPEDYDRRIAAATSLTAASRSMIAAELAVALNARIRKKDMPHNTLEGKKAICEFIEKSLEPLGLAVKAPNTPGLPGKLKATTGNNPNIGKFYFEVYVDGKQTKPAYSDTLPELELIDSTPPVNSETVWQEKVGTKSSRLGRKRS